MIEIEEREGTVIFFVGVTSRSRRDAAGRKFGGAVKVRLQVLPWTIRRMKRSATFWRSV